MQYLTVLMSDGFSDIIGNIYVKFIMIYISLMNKCYILFNFDYLGFILSVIPAHIAQASVFCCNSVLNS
jgi:hypothetical protein